MKERRVHVKRQLVYHGQLLEKERKLQMRLHDGGWLLERMRRVHFGWLLPRENRLMVKEKGLAGDDGWQLTENE